jgi:hypothetical protein
MYQPSWCSKQENELTSDYTLKCINGKAHMMGSVRFWKQRDSSMWKEFFSSSQGSEELWYLASSIELSTKIVQKHQSGRG